MPVFGICVRVSYTGAPCFLEHVSTPRKKSANDDQVFSKRNRVRKEAGTPAARLEAKKEDRKARPTHWQKQQES
ncbi:hypothetical protein AYR62_14385 [Secundilactobacillus paracollinoides]|nr:hypothetical protein AYR62_14385 [Secundilactobacillus paracollinoides]